MNVILTNKTHALKRSCGRYGFRVVRAGTAVRVSFGTLSPGNVNERHVLG